MEMSFAPITLEAWCNDYEQLIRTQPLKANTIRDRLNYVRHLRNALGGRILQEIEPLDVLRVLRTLEDAGTPYMRRRVRIEAIQLFNEAIIARRTRYNPAAAIRYWPTRPARSRLSFEHWATIRAWATAHGMEWFALALDLALVTGQRRADLVALAPTAIVDGHLRVHQQKTGSRIALPLELHLHAADLRLGDVVERLLAHGAPGPTLLRKRDGRPYSTGHLSNTFKEARKAALPGYTWAEGRRPPSLHEIRSLSERLYRRQGLDTMTLLGHTRQSMTDAYNDARGLEDWRVLAI
ncbi:tyrosine-type recombinase/integrase [Pseudomonas citronellolis]|uniref:tyrosine-type recombinase/integrase n=1 Tax=Pseudomonas citronellolis TaxID=53408 RepID=UPI0007187773|nr:tyrosine-type recombinase/integrase [Pseudomonas citronellolis]KRV76360.1 hypothetical protein AO742_12570 [Pseudomonas citronellolis]KRW79605.1 hypothetical protein AO738_13695 [Pseudomonas citronellolis]